MKEKSILKAALLMLVIVVVVVGSYELYLRNQGKTISYDDGTALWSDKRAMTSEPKDKSIVFIGSSRIKYDLDIPTWEKTTGFHAVQLAVEGSCPRPILEDLANDPNFKGKLVIDVTEGLFFSNAPPNMESPVKNIKYFHDRTPAQRASFELNKVLESQFVFLDKESFSLNARLDQLELKSRPGVFMMPIFPYDFGRTTFDRQAYMTDKFTQDMKLRIQVMNIWKFFSDMHKLAPPMPASELEGIFKSVKVAVDKIKARGGEVLFVRTPSSGPYLQGETIGFPRAQYWDKLLKYTNCPGIHFQDYPAIAHFDCPEFSHLKKTDAVIYTKNFIEILDKEKGWKVLPSKN
jgi:hypothetical protein